MFWSATTSRCGRASETLSASYRRAALHGAVPVISVSGWNSASSGMCRRRDQRLELTLEPSVAHRELVQREADSLSRPLCGRARRRRRALR